MEEIAKQSFSITPVILNATIKSLSTELQRSDSSIRFASYALCGSLLENLCKGISNKKEAHKIILLLERAYARGLLLTDFELATITEVKTLLTPIDFSRELALDALDIKLASYLSGPASYEFLTQLAVSFKISVAELNDLSPLCSMYTLGFIKELIVKTL
jgi:hypothetical protein